MCFTVSKSPVLTGLSSVWRQFIKENLFVPTNSMGSAVPHSVPCCARITLHSSAETKRPPATSLTQWLDPDSLALSQAALCSDIQELHSDLHTHWSPGHWAADLTYQVRETSSRMALKSTRRLVPAQCAQRLRVFSTSHLGPLRHQPEGIWLLPQPGASATAFCLLPPQDT